jgi:hypothetical protein
MTATGPVSETLILLCFIEYYIINKAPNPVILSVIHHFSESYLKHVFTKYCFGIVEGVIRIQTDNYRTFVQRLNLYSSVGVLFTVTRPNVTKMVVLS